MKKSLFLFALISAGLSCWFAGNKKDKVYNWLNEANAQQSIIYGQSYHSENWRDGSFGDLIENVLGMDYKEKEEDCPTQGSNVNSNTNTSGGSNAGLGVDFSSGAGPDEEVIYDASANVDLSTNSTNQSQTQTTGGTIDTRYDCKGGANADCRETLCS